MCDFLIRVDKRDITSGTNETSVISADNSMPGFGATHVRALSLPTKPVTLMPPNGRYPEESGPVVKRARGTKLDASNWKDLITTSRGNSSGKVSCPFLSNEKIRHFVQNGLRRSTRLLNTAAGSKQAYSVKASGTHPPCCARIYSLSASTPTGAKKTFP